MDDYLIDTRLRMREIVAFSNEHKLLSDQIKKEKNINNFDIISQNGYITKIKTMDNKDLFLTIHFKSFLYIHIVYYEVINSKLYIGYHGKKYEFDSLFKN